MKYFPRESLKVSLYFIQFQFQGPQLLFEIFKLLFCSYLRFFSSNECIYKYLIYLEKNLDNFKVDFSNNLFFLIHKLHYH